MTETRTLSGKTAIITGASSGIGRSIATCLSRAGAHVYLAGRSTDLMKETQKQLEDSGGRATVVGVDVRDIGQLQELVAGALRETGRLDIMVNNAGLSYPGAIADADPEHWREMLETNVLGLLVGSQAAIRAMRQCGAEGTSSISHQSLRSAATPECTEPPSTQSIASRARSGGSSRTTRSAW